MLIELNMWSGLQTPTSGGETEIFKTISKTADMLINEAQYISNNINA